MTTCKANSCYTSTSYSRENYCSYHEKKKLPVAILVIYEPAVRSMNDDISAIKYDNYNSLSYAKDKA